LTTIARQHWLVTASAWIDDGKTPVTERDISICAEPISLAIRAAMRQQIRQT
jgi:hypothetical protein